MTTTDTDIHTRQREVVLNAQISGGLSGINAALGEAGLPTIDTLRDFEETFVSGAPDMVRTLAMIEAYMIMGGG